VRWLPQAHVGDGGHDLRPHADAADGVVYRLLAVAIQKDGISAQSLQRSLEIGSYPTAWAMLHRLRSVLVRPGRDRLSGTVEVDETFIGGDEPGLRGGRAKGKKVLTGIAVEVAAPKGIGRCRMAVLADASAESLNPFVTGAIEPGSTVITDAWQGYSGLDSLGYTRERRSQRAARARGEDPGELLPAVHRVASLAKRWLLGTHQGSVDENHLPSYLNEFVFRFNRRRSRSRGLVFYRVLELAAGHDPVRFQDLLASKKPRPAPAARGWGHPPSLDRPAANRPWRTGELQLQLPIPLRLSEYPLVGLCRGPDYADAVSGSPGQRGGRCPGIGITRRGSLAVCLSGVVSVSLQTGERAWRRERAPAASWLATVSGRRRCWRSSACGWSGSGVCQRRRSAVTATR
jgi:transposase-like protein